MHTVWTQAQWRGPEDPGRRPKNSREVSGQSVVGGFAHPVPDLLRQKGPDSVGVRWDGATYTRLAFLGVETLETKPRMPIIAVTWDLSAQRPWSVSDHFLTPVVVVP